MAADDHNMRCFLLPLLFTFWMDYGLMHKSPPCSSKMAADLFKDGFQDGTVTGVVLLLSCKVIHDHVAKFLQLARRVALLYNIHSMKKKKLCFSGVYRSCRRRRTSSVTLLLQSHPQLLLVL